MKTLLSVLWLCSALALSAQEQDREAAMAKVKQLEGTLHYQTGTIDLKTDLAKITLPDDFRYLNAQDAETVLSKIWGNPPDSDTLGLLIPADVGPLDSNCWVVVITYTEDGYVKDSDADKIDYTKLLKEMQASAREHNSEREKEGYPAIELVGWAKPPRYDQSTHKMYWAKEIKFDGSPDNTLNYGIRVLGRRGVLVLNAVASMSQLPMIEKSAPAIVQMVDFNEGNRYADFNGSTDKVAAYGLAALVAGGIAAKAGLFKLIWIGILGAKKFIIIGFIAIAAVIKKLFGKKESA